MNSPGLLGPHFVELDDALALHEASIIEFGGSPGLRDPGLLESALAQPKQSFGGQFTHDYPFHMASAYAYHLAKNHPFVDGNKRVALACCVMFLHANGWNLLTPDILAAQAVLELIEGRHTKESFAQWLSENSQPRPSIELRDFLQEVTFSRIDSFVASIVANPRQSELAATYHDAALVCPAILDLIELRDASYKRAEEQVALGQLEASKELVGGGDMLNGMAAALVALHRLAEDLGYEW